MWKIPAPGRRHRDNTIPWTRDTTYAALTSGKGFSHHPRLSPSEKMEQKRSPIEHLAFTYGKNISVPVSRDSKKKGKKNKNKQSPPPISPPRRSPSTWRNCPVPGAPHSSAMFQSERLGMWFYPKSLLPGCLLPA